MSELIEGVMATSGPDKRNESFSADDLQQMAKDQAPTGELNADLLGKYDALVEKVYALGQAMSVGGIADGVSQVPQVSSEQQQSNSTAS